MVNDYKQQDTDLQHLVALLLTGTNEIPGAACPAQNDIDTGHL